MYMSYFPYCFSKFRFYKHFINKKKQPFNEGYIVIRSIELSILSLYNENGFLKFLKNT